MPKTTDDNRITEIQDALNSLKHTDSNVAIWNNRVFIFLNTDAPDEDDLNATAQLLRQLNLFQGFDHLLISNGTNEIRLSGSDIMQNSTSATNDTYQADNIRESAMYILMNFFAGRMHLSRDDAEELWALIRRENILPEDESSTVISNITNNEEMTFDYADPERIAPTREEQLALLGRGLFVKAFDGFYFDGSF